VICGQTPFFPPNNQTRIFNLKNTRKKGKTETKKEKYKEKGVDFE